MRAKPYFHLSDQVAKAIESHPKNALNTLKNGIVLKNEKRLKRTITPVTRVSSYQGIPITELNIQFVPHFKPKNLQNKNTLANALNNNVKEALTPKEKWAIIKLNDKIRVIRKILKSMPKKAKEGFINVSHELQYKIDNKWQSIGIKETERTFSRPNKDAKWAFKSLKQH